MCLMPATHADTGSRLVNDTWGESTREMFDERCTNG
jgi:hypothetical protein